MRIINHWLCFFLLQYRIATTAFQLNTYSAYLPRRTQSRLPCYDAPQQQYLGESKEDYDSDQHRNHQVVNLSISSWKLDSIKRRNVMFGLGGLMTAHAAWQISGGNDAWADMITNNAWSRLLQPSTSPSSLYVLSPRKNATTTPQREPLDSEPYELSSELCLLSVLPVKNPTLRSLEKSLISVSTSLRGGVDNSVVAWSKAFASAQEALATLDGNRGQLAPVFNPNDSTFVAIVKGERGEVVLEELRDCLVKLMITTKAQNATSTYATQKQALLALSQVGELLVQPFPYAVPVEGKYSYLPRLLGRCRVTFVLRRGNNNSSNKRRMKKRDDSNALFNDNNNDPQNSGPNPGELFNITMVADGYLAPITAGNFVDLCARNFYTGLPIKFAKKCLVANAASAVTAAGLDFEVATVPLWGSYQEGFYDPLTAKLRRIPLEILRVEVSNGVPSLSYAQGLSSLSGTTAVSLQAPRLSKNLLSFNIPGLVAMNHPDKNLNGASSEFFALQDGSVTDGKRKLLDGEYAPFGYITEGYEYLNALQPQDTIERTVVDDFGLLNLVKIRESSFSEVVQGAGQQNGEEEENANGDGGKSIKDVGDAKVETKRVLSRT